MTGRQGQVIDEYSEDGSTMCVVHMTLPTGNPVNFKIPKQFLEPEQPPEVVIVQEPEPEKPPKVVQIKREKPRRGRPKK